MGQDAQPLEPPEAIRRRLDLDDARLRGECVVHTHRVGGPGGQHRNKTESAVRLLHRPSGIVVTGEERRSQHQNAANALSRLREAIAVRFRAPLPVVFAWPEGVQIRDRKLRVSERNPAYFHVLGMALDALAAADANPAPAAAALGVSTSSLVRILADNPRAWQEANRLRSEAGLGPLRAD
ncbi:MAG: peptide chain release factor-like protein [Phycisphaerales bacterium]|nr:peptide chain release factor-like protein [Phycisphaerales bacterium]